MAENAASDAFGSNSTGPAFYLALPFSELLGALWHDHRQPSFVVHHKVNCSNISRKLWPKITKFYTDIRINLCDNHTGYDVTNCFRLAAKCN